MANPFGSGDNWVEPLMPDGTRIEDDPEYQAFASAVFNFEFEQACMLDGVGNSGGPSEMFAPSNAVPGLKVRSSSSQRLRVFVPPGVAPSSPPSPSSRRLPSYSQLPSPSRPQLLLASDVYFLSRASSNFSFSRSNPSSLCLYHPVLFLQLQTRSWPQSQVHCSVVSTLLLLHHTRSCSILYEHPLSNTRVSIRRSPSWTTHSLHSAETQSRLSLPSEVTRRQRPVPMPTTTRTISLCPA